MLRRTLVAGSGLYVAGERAAAVVDVVGRCRMPDGSEKEPERREQTKISLGERSAHRAY